MADWNAILDRPDTDPRPAIIETAAKLDAIFQTRPQADQEVLALLSKHLGEPIGETTGRDLKIALANYLSEDAAYLIAWSIQVEDRLAIVEEVAPPRVAAFVRAIAGLHGTELKLAFNRLDQPPNDWFSINREIYVDLINDRMLVKVRIGKYNGEQVSIEGQPYSILELTANMLRTCRMVGRADAFTPRTIEMTIQEIDEFLKLVHEGPKRESEPPTAAVNPEEQQVAQVNPSTEDEH